MNKSDNILIIGAGAAGLMAAYELTSKGKKVTVLEARDRIGGRAYTIYDRPFEDQVETGAEFVHGTLPVTLGLLDKAGIAYSPIGGEQWSSINGKMTQNSGLDEHWELLMKKLFELKEDCSILDFVNTHFSGEKYAQLRKMVVKFAEGYDAADAAKASAFSLREEWAAEEDTQYRIDDGYAALLNYLYDECLAGGAIFYLNTSIQTLEWKAAKVTATTKNGAFFEGTKAIITLPLGVLLSNKNEEGNIQFLPEIPAQMQAASEIGFGDVIKFCLQFQSDFWLSSSFKKENSADLTDLNFLISDQQIPTWWTQFPKKSNLLIGWLAGPNAAAKKDATNEQLFNEAIESLGKIFHCNKEFLLANLSAWKIFNWTADPYTRGAYAYSTVRSAEARKILVEPVENTLFFAGEALWDGNSMGTVEAAFSSAKETVGKLLVE